ncbi:MAG: hypothetical protein M3Z02_02315 [Actinomycetota bacterium]|nr:hypothetical protein [Actinomycetota bacterium]
MPSVRELGGAAGDGTAAAGWPARTEWRDGVGWLLLVGAGLALTALAVALHARIGTASAPFTGRYRVKITPGTLLAPAVAVAVLAGVRARLHERLGWRWLMLTGYLAALAWALALAVVDGGSGLAAPVTDPQEYLRDLPAVAGHPARFLAGFVAASGHYTVATRQHPPAPVLLLAGIRQVGIVRPAAIGLAITLVGCLTVPLVAVATRSLCGAGAARRLVPVLVLAPYAVWVAVSMDAVTTAVCAAALTCGVLASEARRSPWWAAACGLLLGVGALFSYAVAWLGVTVIVCYFVRRRPLLNIFTGLAALVPLALARGAGFVWPDGLTAAQADFSLRVEPHRSWLVWSLLDILLLLLACGPTAIAAVRKTRRTPGWPFLVGAGLAVGFALASGLSRGEVERSWLPFFPWLLVPAVAPERRPPAGRDGNGENSAPTPLLLVGIGALSAVVTEAVLRTTW